MSGGSLTRFVARRPGGRVGKVVGSNVYVHTSAAAKALPLSLLQLVLHQMWYLPPMAEYNIIKIDRRSNRVSFLYSPDWDTASEPQVTVAYTMVPEDDGYRCRVSTYRGVIYHHKWMFVADDYPGFDVAASKAWSEYWENHPHVVALKNDPDEKFKSKIGMWDYWKKNVLDHLQRKFG